MTRTLELDRLARGVDTATFARAIRETADTTVGTDGFTASGGSKQGAPNRPGLGSAEFVASGDGKMEAGGRAELGTEGFTASGDGKRIPAPRISSGDFTASGGVKDA